MPITQNLLRNFSLFALVAAVTAISSCATHPMRHDVPETTVLTGEWKGGLAVPEEFSSNRGMLDPSCDHEASGSENIKFRVSQVGDNIEVEGHLRCSLHGKSVYSAEIPVTHLELRGQDLMLNGAKVGTATPVYFSMDAGGGKLTIVKYPTWEKVFYEANSRSSDSPIALSGVFEDRENFADEGGEPETSQPTARVPANAPRAD